jgi:clan AA aspartic protease
MIFAVPRRKAEIMGNVYAELTIKNSADLAKVRDGSIPDKEARSLALTALVDTGASTLVINEDVCQKLGLSILETRIATLAGKIKTECKITEPVDICWKDRSVSCNALVLPEGEPLLGVIPLEFMDLIVDPARNELIPAHGDHILTLIM